jgi:hypothetical protein
MEAGCVSEQKKLEIFMKSTFYYVTIFCIWNYFGKKLIKSNESFVQHMYVWSNSNWNKIHYIIIGVTLQFISWGHEMFEDKDTHDQSSYILFNELID